jgi:hypothetical protein
MQEPHEPQGINFGESIPVAALGTLSGVAIAIVVPWLLLTYGQSLGVYVLTGLIILALCIGGLVSLVSAFFGLVIPRHAHGRWMDPERWMDFAREAQQWRHDAPRGRKSERVKRP